MCLASSHRVNIRCCVCTYERASMHTTCVRARGYVRVCIHACMHVSKRQLHTGTHPPAYKYSLPPPRARTHTRTRANKHTLTRTCRIMNNKQVAFFEVNLMKSCEDMDVRSTPTYVRLHDYAMYMMQSDLRRALATANYSHWSRQEIWRCLCALLDVAPFGGFVDLKTWPYVRV